MKSFLTGLARAEGLAVTATFLVMVALYFVNVVTRAIGSAYATDLFWVEEAVRVLMLYLVFLGCGLALQQGRHVGVYAWRDRIAARTGLPIRPLIDVLGLVFCLWMAWLAVAVCRFVLSSGQTIPSLGMSAVWLYVAPVLGFLLMALRFAASLFGVIDRFTPQMHEAGE